jgi:protein phosphatase
VTHPLDVDVAALSDVGYRRPNNEDSFGYDQEARLYVVCDGMGGVAGGEIASKVAVETTLRVARELCRQHRDPEAILPTAIAAANEAVWKMAQQDARLRGMGTTLVVAYIVDNQLLVGNVGDSRAHLLRDGDCVQITEDHSYAAEQMRLIGGALPSAISARFKQCITRAVGVDSVVQPDIFTRELRAGDSVLLSTDGLTRYADADKIATHLANQLDPQAACRRLISIAHEAGAEDNVTCLLLRMR